MRALCVVCGTDMWPCRPNKMFCSEKCKSIDRRRLEREAQAEENARKRCQRCGGPMPANKRRDARHCSRACTMAGPHYFAGTRTCEWCGTEFRASNKDQRTCSISCGQKLRQAKAKARRELAIVSPKT